MHQAINRYRAENGLFALQPHASLVPPEDLPDQLHVGLRVAAVSALAALRAGEAVP